MSYNDLETLAGLEGFTELRELVVDNNLLGAAESMCLPEKMDKLELLSLNKNRIREIEPLLDILAARCPKLSYLSLLGNDACPNELVEKDEDDYQRYRYFVLHKLPQLRFLDSRSVKDAERAEAKRIGQYMRVARLTVDDISTNDPGDGGKSNSGGSTSALSPDTPPTDSSASTDPYSALPAEFASDTNPAGRATFGVSKYVYYGRHSEGTTKKIIQIGSKKTHRCIGGTNECSRNFKCRQPLYSQQ